MMKNHSKKLRIWWKERLKACYCHSMNLEFFFMPKHHLHIENHHKRKIIECFQFMALYMLTIILLQYISGTFRIYLAENKQIKQKTTMHHLYLKMPHLHKRKKLLSFHLKIAHTEVLHCNLNFLSSISSQISENVWFELLISSPFCQGGILTVNIPEDIKNQSNQVM